MHVEWIHGRSVGRSATPSYPQNQQLFRFDTATNSVDLPACLLCSWGISIYTLYANQAIPPQPLPNWIFPANFAQLCSHYSLTTSINLLRRKLDQFILLRIRHTTAHSKDIHVSIRPSARIGWLIVSLIQFTLAHTE